MDRVINTPAMTKNVFLFVTFFLRKEKKRKEKKRKEDCKIIIGIRRFSLF